jgi:hypothetical protein
VVEAVLEVVDLLLEVIPALFLVLKEDAQVSLSSSRDRLPQVSRGW